MPNNSGYWESCRVCYAHQKHVWLIYSVTYGKERLYFKSQCEMGLRHAHTVWVKLVMEPKRWWHGEKEAVTLKGGAHTHHPLLCNWSALHLEFSIQPNASTCPSIIEKANNRDLLILQCCRESYPILPARDISCYIWIDHHREGYWRGEIQTFTEEKGERLRWNTDLECQGGCCCCGHCGKLKDELSSERKEAVHHNW
jgi:hypothetical protein